MSVKFKYYSSVTEKEVEWLWYPYIPYGKLTLLQGDPGEGKSTFILNVVALLTKGKAMPDGYKSSGVQSFVPQDGDMHSAGRMRSLLGNLSAVAD